jgi:hypothetical protein
MIPLKKRLAAVEKDRITEQTLRLRSEFFIANDISEETSNTMGEILKEKVAKAPTPEAKQKVIDHWSHPDQLQDWYDIARSREINASKDVIADEATQKERERIAQQGRAAGVNRNAQSVPQPKVEDELTKLWSND